jgi:decaprenylphospho-beta-D-ribofuranose 2-oxidase
VSTVLTGWGRTPASVTSTVCPGAGQDITALLADAGQRGAIARGLGRSYGDAAQNGGGRTILTRGRRRLLAWDAASGVVRAEAGATIGEIAALGLPDGWFPKVVPGTRHVTLGGAVAADIHGKNHHRDGSFSTTVRSFTLASPARGVVEVTPAGDPELFRATCGGMGLTGVVLEVELQLHPVETGLIRMHTERLGDLDSVMAQMQASDQAWRYSVAWVDLLARGSALGRGLLDRGEHALRTEVPTAQRSAAAGMNGSGAPAPPALPFSALRRPLVALANGMRYRRGTCGERYVSTGEFFHPLDRVGEWSRLYGPRGMVQYQFAVPEAGATVVHEVVGELARRRAPAFLAVLKRFGPTSDMLAFPVGGWTLAADFPAGWDALGPLLDRFDEDVAKAGGRVYLAKDGRMRPEMVPAMYPQLGRWRAAVHREDPAGVMQSDLSRRLDLRGDGR